jgi:hypothetical protein
MNGHRESQSTGFLERSRLGLVRLEGTMFGAPRRALSQAQPRRAKQAEVEIKVEFSRHLPSQPLPVPKPFRKPAEFFTILSCQDSWFHPIDYSKPAHN